MIVGEDEEEKHQEESIAPHTLFNHTKKTTNRVLSV